MHASDVRTIASASSSLRRAPRAQTEFELGGVRKLRRAAEAAVRRVEALLESGQRLRAVRGTGSSPPPAGSRLAIASASRAFCWAICSPCWRYAAATRGSRSTKPGKPYRPSFGK